MGKLQNLQIALANSAFKLLADFTDEFLAPFSMDISPISSSPGFRPTVSSLSVPDVSLEHIAGSVTVSLLNITLELSPASEWLSL